MTDIWKKKDLGTNPYRETAFKALGLTRDAVTRGEIAQRAEERKQALAAMPDYYELGQRPLTAADINAAQQVLLAPSRRMEEELLEHQPEPFPAQEVERQLPELPWPERPTGPPPLANRAFWGHVARELACQALGQLPEVKLPPRPVATAPPPPMPLPEQNPDE